MRTRGTLRTPDRRAVRTDADTLDRASDQTESLEDWAPPQQIGRYRVLEMLGEGGMGIVYLAADPKLGRKVAIKLIRRRGPDGGHLESDKARLLREAMALAKLSHPNVVTIHDVDVHEGALYIAMEYVDGVDLQRWLERKPSWRRIVEVFLNAGRGLAAAHDAGILHRDFKPCNVLIAHDGRVCVADFGLAKAVGSWTPALVESAAIDLDPSSPELVTRVQGAKLTAVGRSVGTPAYMAPEQRLGFDVGAAADQFAFGVSLFEALYGRLPFGEDTEEIFRRASRGAIEPVPQGPVPLAIRRAIERALQPDPAHRFPSMRAMLAALHRPPTRRRAAWAAGGVVAGGLMSFGGYGLFGPTGATCEGARRMAELWSPEREAELGDAFAAADIDRAADTWARVDAGLDDYALRWSAARLDVCEATHVRKEQSEALLDVRMACLDRALHRTGALLDALTTVDADAIDHAVTAMGALPAPEACVDAPADHAASETELARHRELDRVEASYATGRYREALQALEGLPEQSAEPGPLARAHRLRAMVLERLGQTEPAVKALHRAIAMAAEADDARQEAEAWALLTALTGSAGRQPTEALAMVPAVDAALRRAGRPPDVAFHVAHDLGLVHAWADRLDEALGFQRDAVELARRTFGPDHPNLAAALGGLGMTLARRGDLAGARAALSEALAVDERGLGPSHPDLAGSHLNLGRVAALAGDLPSARASYTRAVALRERTLGPDHPATAEARASLAEALAGLGEHDLARQQLEAAVAALRRAAHPSLSLALVMLARHRLALDEASGVVALLDEATGQPAVAPELLAEIAALRATLTAPVLTADRRPHTPHR